MYVCICVSNSRSAVGSVARGAEELKMMYVYMYVYVCMSWYVCIQNSCIHVCMYVRTYVCTHVFAHLCAYTRTYRRVYAHVNKCIDHKYSTDNSC